MSIIANSVVDHGAFPQYVPTPEEWPANVPTTANVIFGRNADGVDFYDLIREFEPIDEPTMKVFAYVEPDGRVAFQHDDFTVDANGVPARRQMPLMANPNIRLISITGPASTSYVDLYWNGGVEFLDTKPVTDLLAYAAIKRKAKEGAGLVVPPGVSIATDDRSKLMLMGARVAAEANPEFSTPWEDAAGNTVMLTAAQIIGVSNAVLAHVAGCFATFASVKTDIANGTITTSAQIDEAFAA